MGDEQGALRSTWEGKLSQLRQFTFMKPGKRGKRQEMITGNCHVPNPWRVIDKRSPRGGREGVLRFSSLADSPDITDAATLRF